ncbi:hypothetical protein, partial [Aeromonas salmonicida]|uniref:hypothetical protein n=1 Tax=Aeromonas salmonicida TaxID=645 RepID=UPI00223EE744
MAPAGSAAVCAGEFGLDGLIQAQYPAVITAMNVALAFIIQIDAAHIINGIVVSREFNFEVQFPIKNQAAFRSSSKTTCGCLNPKHLRGLKFSRFS